MINDSLIVQQLIANASIPEAQIKRVSHVSDFHIFAVLLALSLPRQAISMLFFEQSIFFFSFS